MGNLIPQVDEPGYSRRRSVVGAKPEAADLKMGFRSAPVPAIRISTIGRLKTTEAV
jgi:hypothetical protein